MRLSRHMSARVGSARTAQVVPVRGVAGNIQRNAKGEAVKPSFALGLLPRCSSHFALHANVFSVPHLVAFRLLAISNSWVLSALTF